MTGSKNLSTNLQGLASAPPTQFYFSDFPALCHPLTQTTSPHPTHQITMTGMTEQGMAEDTTHTPSPSSGKRVFAILAFIAISAIMTVMTVMTRINWINCYNISK
jgi:hypothetical protein